MTNHTTDPHSVPSTLAQPARGAHLKDISSAAKPQLRPGSQTCQCANCGRFFTGVAAFDSHLTSTASPDPKCLSEKRMLKIGLTQNVNGVWQGRAKAQAQK